MFGEAKTSQWLSGYSENLHKWANASFVFSRRSCNHKLQCVRRRPCGKTQTPMKKMKMLRTLTRLNMKNLSSRPELLMKFILDCEFMLQSISWSQPLVFCDSEPFCSGGFTSTSALTQSLFHKKTNSFNLPYKEVLNNILGCNGSQNSRFGSIRHSGVTVRYVFDTGGGDWLCHNVGNISVLKHEGKPVDITQAPCKLCAIFMPVNVLIAVNSL